MASSRKTGTNESRWTGSAWAAGVNTYGVEKDYTTLDTWEADTDVNIVTAAVSPVLECYAGTYNDTVSLAGATTSATYFRIIRPASGNKHSGTPSTGVIFSGSVNGISIGIAESYSTVQDISVINAGNSASTIYAFAITGTVTAPVIVGCFGKCTNAGAGAGYAFYSGSGVVSSYLKNCCGYSSKTANFAGNSTIFYCFNCTSYDSSAGFTIVSGGMACYGCGAASSTTGFHASITLRNCSSTDPTFINAATQDFHLALTDTAWRHCDVNAPTEWHSVAGYDDDIDGNTRNGVWDIGFDDTMGGSSRKVGYSENINTYGTGQTYTSLATWEADTDIANGDTTQVLEVYGNGYDDGGLTLAGSSVNVGRVNRIIRAASGNKLTSGAISSYHFVYTGALAGVFSIGESYTEIQDIVCKHVYSSSSSRYVFSVSGNFTDCGYVGCVAIDSINNGTGTANGFYSRPITTATNFMYFKNCLAHNCESSGYYLDGANGATTKVYNCTSVGNGSWGFTGVPTYTFTYGCGATGNVAGQINSNITQTNCSSSAPTFAAGTDNFHLASNDTVWKDADTNTNGWHADYDDDIDGTTRTGSWDIGWDEAAASVSSPSTSPSATPSTSPSGSPSASPSHSPSATPSTSPSGSPSASPSASSSPSGSPSTSPSHSPSGSPSASPSVPASQEVVIFTADGLWTDTSTSFYNFRMVIPSGQITADATKIKVRLRAHSTANYSIVGCSIGERSGTSDDFTGTPTRVTFDTGSNSTTVNANTPKESDEITFRVDRTNDYLVHIYVNSFQATPYINNTGLGYLTYIDVTNTDFSQNQTWTSASSFADYLYFIDEIISTVPPDKEYSRGGYDSLPTDAANLDIAYSAQDYLDVENDDSAWVDQLAVDQYAIHQFKDLAGEHTSAYLTWKGQTNSTPSASHPVKLQIYNQQTTTWTDLVTNTTADADTDFTMTYFISDLTDYKSNQDRIFWRVYQSGVPVSSPSGSPSTSPSGSPSATPSASPSASSSPSGSPSTSPSGSPSASPSGVSTPSTSPSASPSASSSPSSSPSATPSTSPSGSPSASPSGGDFAYDFTAFASDTYNLGGDWYAFSGASVGGQAVSKAVTSASVDSNSTSIPISNFYGTIPISGAVYFDDDHSVAYYTSKDASNFLGVTGIVGTHNSGVTVRPTNWHLLTSTMGTSKRRLRNDNNWTNAGCDMLLHKTFSSADSESLSTWAMNNVGDPNYDRSDIRVLARVKDADHYYMVYYNSPYLHTLYIYKDDNNTFSQLGSSADFTSTANDIIHIRFRVQGTALKARIWKNSDSEPGTWQIETTDTAITGVGTVGVESFAPGGNAERMDIETFSVEAL